MPKRSNPTPPSNEVEVQVTSTSDRIDSAIDATAAHAKNIVDTTATKTNDAAETIKTTVQNTADKVETTVRNAADKVETTVHNAADTVETTVRNTAHKVKATAHDVKDTVTSFSYNNHDAFNIHSREVTINDHVYDVSTLYTAANIATFGGATVVESGAYAVIEAGRAINSLYNFEFSDAIQHTQQAAVNASVAYALMALRTEYLLPLEAASVVQCFVPNNIAAGVGAFIAVIGAFDLYNQAYPDADVA